MPQRTVDVPVVTRSQDHAFQGVQKTVLPQKAVVVPVVQQRPKSARSANCSDDAVDATGTSLPVVLKHHVPVVLQCQVPTIGRSQRTTSSTQVLHSDEELDVFVAAHMST